MSDVQWALHCCTLRPLSNTVKRWTPASTQGWELRKNIFEIV